MGTRAADLPRWWAAGADWRAPTRRGRCAYRASRRARRRGRARTPGQQGRRPPPGASPSFLALQDLATPALGGQPAAHTAHRTVRLALESQALEGLYTTVNRLDRNSTRLNSSHTVISYAVFCL